SFENDQGHIAVSDAFEPGTKIRVFKGELEGFDGIFLESRGDDRAIILLNLLNRMVKTELSGDLLEAV
ncbi:MAG: transcriptional activator RfaH, partial [Proteobacteria bacterium]|nr:transcriptional activator RfaH [Pseudomonadota bacterium]MBU1709858.1 transcriptional activator RfaH [Pseudomonadota bacterium]